jgi:beta-phosphoglucomutase
MSIKAIIFDMDGVLIEAKEWHFKSLNKALQLFGDSISIEEHLKKYDGLPTKQKLKILTDEGRIPSRIHNLINNLKQKITYDYIQKECGPIYQHEYALSKLKRDGYKLGLASNSIRKTVELMLAKSNLDIYFDLILSSSDVKKPKPDPEIYISAIQKLSIAPEECLIIEDNEYGILAAKASKAYVMIVSNPWDVSYKNIIKKIGEL